MGRYIMKFKEYLEKLESLDISKTLLIEGVPTLKLDKDVHWKVVQQQQVLIFSL